MANLNELSLADIKSSLDFVRELKAKQIKLSELLTNDYTVKSLTELEEKLYSHLFFRVNKLKKYD